MHNWDTIIVGAGSAGCVLAARLSEDPSHKVLLLEAGGSDRRLWVRLPIGYARTFRDPAVNWMLQTEPEPGLGGRRSYWPRGKLLGGSGSINAMAYVRGSPHDFDGWARLGNPGWGWDEVLPFFLRSEDHADGASRWHGSGGPLHVARNDDHVHALCANFLDAAQSLGMPRSADFNGETMAGVGIYPITTRRGWRVSTASAFLRPAMRRGNLRVRSHARATRVLVHEGRASGVEYLCPDGTPVQVHAGREVIVCAGAIHSPQLLQLSGIGDPDLLRRFGLPVHGALPAVGHGLQDHLHITHVYRSKLPTLNDDLGPWQGKLRAALRFLWSCSGPLSMSVNQAGGFASSRMTTTTTETSSAHDALPPDLQLYFNPASYSTRVDDVARRAMRPDPFSGFSMSVHACRPTSRGTIAIASADPLQAPRIAPNYLSTPYDVDQALAGARLLRRLAAADALRAVIESEILPGPSCRSDDELLADFRARADTIFHPVGTCAMGPSAASAVVDARLRVHGVSGLRVVDASVFPAITSGNTNAPTIMVAEKAAQMLREDAASGN